MDTLSVSMLGGTGVGKTSLLAAMYEQLQANIDEVGLQLTPDPESSARLGESLTQLKKQAFSFRFEGGITGTSHKEEFAFELGQVGQQATLQLRFIDYPGGYIATKEKGGKIEDVYYFIKNSRCVIIAIDSCALMEENGKYNETINKQFEIREIFKNEYRGLNDKRLVILCPIKCETYLNPPETKPERTEELLAAVKQTHGDLLRFFASDALREKVAVVITPVQTVGNAYFSHLEEIKTKDKKGKEIIIPTFHYRRNRYGVAYEPRDNEQPLRQILHFFTLLHYKRSSGGIWNPIRRWLGRDKHWLDAVQKFAEGCKTGDGFEVLQQIII